MITFDAKQRAREWLREPREHMIADLATLLATVRNEALENAAYVCDQGVRDERSPAGLAESIRALKVKL